MKKLIATFSILNFLGTSITSNAALINNKKENLEQFEAINKAEANEYGNSNKLVPGTSHRYDWYLRFYMTPAIYNMLLLTALHETTSHHPMFEFYNLFVGEDSKFHYPAWYNSAVAQYKAVMTQYDNFYHTDFTAILRLWLQNNYKYFYSIFLGQNTDLNIYNYKNLPTSEYRKEWFLQTVWRQNGVVLNIPFIYGLAGPNKWTIEKSNLRIFPQVEGIETLFYYYSRPIILIRNIWGKDKVLAKNAVHEIDTAFLNALNPPLKLRTLSYYHIDNNSLQEKEIYQANSGLMPTSIVFNFGIYPKGTTPFVQHVNVKFYLTNPKGSN